MVRREPVDLLLINVFLPDMMVFEVLDQIREIKGEEDKVWIRYEATGTHLGKGWGFEPTDKKVRFEGATILYINSEGKIIDQWGAFCFYDILYELNLVPPFWELSKYVSGMNK